jgi:uncharacterized protein
LRLATRQTDGSTRRIGAFARPAAMPSSTPPSPVSDAPLGCAQPDTAPGLEAVPLAASWPIPSADDEAYPIRIDRAGVWYYHDSPIGRIALVKLFARVLSRDAHGDYWLITPAERGRIRVEDAPFLAVSMERTGEGETQCLTFVTNLDERVCAGPTRPIRVAFDAITGAPRPYVRVRDGLEARIVRSVFYELVSVAVPAPAGRTATGETVDEGWGIWSDGAFFALGAWPEGEDAMPRAMP